jgi:hypothetical protein
LSIAIRHAFIVVATIALLSSGLTLQAQSLNQVTIFAPQPETYDVSLNELELSLPRRTGPGDDTALVEVNGARSLRRQSDSALFEIDAESSTALLAIARTLEDANPGTRTNVVLYVAGQRRSSASRRVLTHEVAVILREGADELTFQRQHLQYAASAFPGVPRAYILHATDSFGALELADGLREQSDVEYAYPLLRQQSFAR